MDESTCGRSGDGTKSIEVVTDTMDQKDNPMLIENSEESNVHDTANQKDNPIIIENLNQSNVDDNRMGSEPMDETACERSGDGTKSIEVETDTVDQKRNQMLIEN